MIADSVNFSQDVHDNCGDCEDERNFDEAYWMPVYLRNSGDEEDEAHSEPHSSRLASIAQAARTFVSYVV